MNTLRPFRFGTGGFPAASRTELITLARKIEELGYATIVMPDILHTATAQKLAWVQQAAGERFAALEINTLVFEVVVTEQRQAAAEQLAQQWGVPADAMLDSVHFLVGTVTEITETVQQWRERFGISYVTVFPKDLEIFAPVVAQLAGR